MTKENNEKILTAYRIAVEKGCQDIAQLLYEVILDTMNGRQQSLPHYKGNDDIINLGEQVITPQPWLTTPVTADTPLTAEWTINDPLTKELSV